MQLNIDKRGLYSRSFRLFCRDVINQPMGDIHQNIISELEEDKKSNFSIMVSRGFYKCLTGDTSIQLLDGSEKTITELIGKTDIPIYSLNHNLKLEPDILEFICENEIVDCYKLELEFNNSLEASYNHPVLTQRGWVQLKDVTINDFVATPRILYEGKKKEISNEEARFLGYIMGDGCTAKGAFSFTNIDPVINKDFVNCLSSIGGTCYRKGISFFCKGKHILNNKFIRGYIKDYIGSGNCRLKQISNNLKVQNNEIISNFLQGYFSSDGFVNEHSNSITLTSVNKQLIIDVKQLLLRFDILSKIYTYENKFGYIYYLNISGKKDVFNYYNKINFVGDKKLKLEKLINAYINIKENTNKDIVPLDFVNIKPYSKIKNIGFNCIYGCSRLKLNNLYHLTKKEKYNLAANSDIYWVKVKSNNYVGKKQTYHTQIKNNHNFITNGIITHNTYMFSRGYPLWLIYRSDKPMHIIIQSMNQDMSRRILGLIRDVLTSNPHFSHFKFKKETDKLLELYMPGHENDSENTHRIYSVPIGTRGLHGDLILCDDVMKDEDGAGANLKKVKTLFWNATSPMANARNGRILFIGTPIAYDDLFFDLQELADKGKGWKFKKYPAMYEDDAGELHSNFPEVYPMPKLLDMRDKMPSYAWEQEYMLNPIAGEDSVFPLSLINSAMDLEFEELTKEDIESKKYYLGCDVAMSSSSTADYSAFVVVSKCKRFLKIEHIWHEKGVSEDKQIEKIKELKRIYNIDAGLIERKGLTYSMAGKVVSDIELVGVLDEWNPTNESKAKIIGNVNLLMKHNMLCIPSNIEHSDKLIKELQNFAIVNNNGTQTYKSISGHDDLVIGVALAVSAAGRWVFEDKPEYSCLII